MFKVMTWNVQNLFRPGGSAGPESQAVYEAKLEGLASMINDQAPTLSACRRSAAPTRSAT